MKSLSKIILFILMNVIGFMSVPICYYIGLASGMVSPTQEGFDHAAFKTYFMIGTYATWLVCALFSSAYFFLKGKERLLFLWAPVIIPVIYGLYVLSRLFSR